MRRWFGILGGMALSLLLANGVKAQSAEEFYKGKTINLIVGFSAGGGYDTTARTLAPYLKKHLPGNPDIIVQNMAGAGSLKAPNYLYNVAPQDGTALSPFSRRTPTGAR